ncbi:MAG: methylisocitrate lyase [Armatimonadetes bacterium]|nr:methylisocitrate lyase [Armatimonadota bacterium]
MAAPTTGGPRSLRDLLASGTHAVPGVFNAAVAKIAERAGFPAVYVSGAGTANGVAGFPDVGLLSLEEVVRHARYTVEAVSVPVIVDADTGFGEPLNVRRTVRELEHAGVAALHLEDQENPKRCGHLAGKRIVPAADMVRKVAGAVDARRSPDFVIIARTDARSVEGLDAAITRARRYVEAGADVIFPEGLETREEFARFAAEIPVPLLGNMTEFGKTPYLSVEEFAALGYRLVLFPMTAFRVAMRAVEEALRTLAQEGTQAGFLDRMQTRKELYELVGYAELAALDEKIAGYE